MLLGLLSTHIETTMFENASETENFKNGIWSKEFWKRRFIVYYCLLFITIYCLLFIVYYLLFSIEGFVRRLAFCTHESHQKEHFLSFF